MSQKPKNAITPTREEDYPEWFQQVVRVADLAESSPVRGCMVIKPWGYAIWEKIQSYLDCKIKESGYENAYFPLFVPLSFLEKEASHVEGFAKECAVVTHHRLEEKGGKLVPSGQLEEPLIVRPTSETIIGEAFSRWVHSYRDLPLRINQWANVVRWEMRPRLFLRTAEFLWQEAHAVYASAAEALEQAQKALELYRQFVEDVLAIPVITGRKSPGERFPGAEETFTIEAMMQDRKALQMGTAHDLGQNFAKAAKIQFSNKEGELEYGHTISWGMTTRTIGAMAMCHSDDDGLRLPPRIASKQIVLIPFVTKPEQEEEVFTHAEKIAETLRNCTYAGAPLSVLIDKRDKRGGEKNWEWIKKGVPIRLELGLRDIEKGAAMVARRDRSPKEKESVSLEKLPEYICSALEEIQQNYYNQAKEIQTQNIRTDIKDFAQLTEFFTPKNREKPEIHGGFVLAKWCGDPQTEKLLDDLKITIRCLPTEQSGTTGKCIITGKEATLDAIFAKSY